MFKSVCLEMKRSLYCLALLCSALVPASCTAQGQTSPVLQPPVLQPKAAPLRFGTLIQNDFDSGPAWAGLKASAVGTIDVAGSTQPSQGLVSSSLISSGPLSFNNTETNLGKLTLAFSLSASAARPVTVRVESLDKNKKRTGGLETLIYPAAPDFFQRYALELSNFSASGTGKFQPTAPFIGFSFSVGGTEWQGVDKSEIRLDNVQFAKPAYYVSATGSDANDGRSEKTAFARPQKAIDMAGPGDIIVVMNGNYKANSEQAGVASFVRPGTPAGWITLKNYPGQTPTFLAVGTWSTVKIGSLVKDGVVPGPALAYLEVRGLHVRGDADVAKEKYATLIGQSNAYTNSNGISVEGRSAENKPHHLRFADNLVEYCAGGGISVIHGDWTAVENNVVRNNCWWMVYAGSGISYLGGYNFDGTDNTYRALIRNNVVSGNRCYQKWQRLGRFSDGNGIIIDSNRAADAGYTGRTLIQNNLSFNNGGSGIHSFKSRRIDIVNNTAYYNGATPELRWGQIFIQSTDDARILNNILVSRDDQPVNVVGKGATDKNNSNFIRANNVYFGGNTPPIMGENDVIADPQFVNATIDAAQANFRLKSESPALKGAKVVPFMPYLDLAGKPRGNQPTRGAYQ